MPELQLEGLCALHTPAPKREVGRLAHLLPTSALAFLPLYSLLLVSEPQRTQVLDRMRLQGTPPLPFPSLITFTQLCP